MPSEWPTRLSHDNARSRHEVEVILACFQVQRRCNVPALTVVSGSCVNVPSLIEELPFISCNPLKFTLRVLM